MFEFRLTILILVLIAGSFSVTTLAYGQSMNLDLITKEEKSELRT